MVYNIIAANQLTLARQAKLIWPSRWGVPKVLFFLNRYMPFIDSVLLPYCTFPCLEYRAIAVPDLVLIDLSIATWRLGFCTCSALHLIALIVLRWIPPVVELQILYFGQRMCV